MVISNFRASFSIKKIFTEMDLYSLILLGSMNFQFQMEKKCLSKPPGFL